MSDARQCGSCSLCCKLPSVRDFNKPIDTWCSHCRPGKGGCSIYADRPNRCRAFVCGWLASDKIPPEWFPAKSKMILQQRGERHVFVAVDPTFPNAWRNEPYHSDIRRWARENLVEIRIGRRFIYLTPDGRERETTRTQAYIEGRSEIQTEVKIEGSGGQGRSRLTLVRPSSEVKHRRIRTAWLHLPDAGQWIEPDRELSANH